MAALRRRIFNLDHRLMARCCPLLMPIVFRKAVTEGLRHGK